MSLVDTHVHVWDTARLHYPWLEANPELPRAADPIDSDTRAVFVQADCVARQALAEVRYVEGLDWPALAGIVAFAALEDGDAVGAMLDELAQHALVVGIRRLLQDEPAGFISSAGFVKGLAAVARRGLVFDATIRADQLDELARAHRVVPEAVVVLDHLGNPPLESGLDSAAGRRWLAGIQAFATGPGAVVKLSGRAAGDEQRGLAFALAALDAFGPDRMMLGSDHPLTVPADSALYRRWAQTAGDQLGLSGDERAAVRHRTAIQVYRLEETAI
jgi:L-fuconolactonase